MSTPRLIFNHPPTTNIYTLSLHDALPIFADRAATVARVGALRDRLADGLLASVPGSTETGDRTRKIAGNCHLRSEGTRLNSSHSQISYAVFCLKKKKIRKSSKLP